MVRRHRIYAGLIAFMVAAVGASAAQAASYKTIRDWTVRCDMAMRCDMTYSNWDNDGLKSVTLRRTLEPNAPLQLVLPAPPEFESKGDAAGRVAVSVDGSAMLDVAVSDMTEHKAYGELVYRGEGVSALAEAMKAGASAEVTYAGDLGRYQLRVPLSGVTGSLLFMDESQDRLDRVDALQTRGDRPLPDRVELAEIVFDGIPASIRDAYADQDADCYVEPDRREYFVGIEIRGRYGRRMVVLPCGTPGAYNQPYTAYHGRDDVLETVQFPEMTHGGPSTLSTLFNVNYDLKTRRFGAFYKGRGLGDCGTSHEWALSIDREEGFLVLKEQRVKDECDGKGDDWPLVWPR